MTTEQSYKETARRAVSMTLVVHPRTDAQRALYVVKQDRLDQQASAVGHAHVKHGAAPLAWLMPDGNLIEVA